MQMQSEMLGALRRTGGARTFLLTSPHAPSVVPMFLMTEEKTVFRSCFSTACSWYVCRVVSLRVLLPNCMPTGAMSEVFSNTEPQDNPNLEDTSLLWYAQVLLWQASSAMSSSQTGPCWQQSAGV